MAQLEFTEIANEKIQNKVEEIFYFLFKYHVQGVGLGDHSQYLFQPERSSNNLHIYDISSKSFNTVKVSFKFPTHSEMAITHVGEECYFAGGYG